MRRRVFIAGLGGAAAWPLVARAQQRDLMRRVDVLMGIAEDDPEAQARIMAFRKGLAELGWFEGRNIKTIFRFAAGEVARIQSYVAELVGTAPDVIVANSTPVIAALRRATDTIPIVFAMVNDPVGQGLISSLARPGGNITGFTFVEFPMIGKWLEILKDIAPATRRVAVLFNPDTAPFYGSYLRQFAAAPHAVAIEPTAAPVHNESEVEMTIADVGREPGSGLIIPPDVFNVVHRELTMRLVELRRIPAVWSYRRFVAEGALVSYGPDTADIFRRSTSYVDRILKGAKPADLPAQSPIKFELAINLKTAKALGIDIPPSLLARADEVIE